MSKRTYVLKIEIEVDDQDDDLLLKLDKMYASGSMSKAATSKVCYGVHADGYRGLGTIVAMRKGLVRGLGEHVDHGDINAGNNKRDNIDIVTISANNRNKTNNISVQSDFKGVYWSSRHKAWQFGIRLISDGSGRAKSISNGRQAWTEIDAALAYNAKVIELGLDRPLNIVPGYTDANGYPLPTGLAAD